MATAHARPALTPTPNPPIVITFSIIPASRGAAILRSIYPDARITVDTHANAVIVVASGYDEEGMHTIATGIDVKNPTDTAVEAYQLKVLSPSAVTSRLGTVFPSARIIVAPNRNVVIMASPSDMAQIKSIVAAIDTAAPTPSPKPRYPAEAVRVTQRNVKDIARAVAASSSGVRVSVSGSEILLAGPQEDVDHAKQLIAELDVPQMGTQYTQVYRIKYVEAGSVADLIRRSYNDLAVVVNTDLNAITVTANMTVQRRLADAIDQLDVAPPGAGAAGQAGGEGGGSGVDVIELRAAVPGLNGGPSTSAADIAQTVTQALQATAPDLHIIVPPNATQLVLTGSPYSIKLAKDLIAKLDIPPQLVALDTEVLELDESTQKQLGIKFPTPALSTTFTEVAPVYPSTNANAGQQIPYLNLFPLIRSPMSLQAQLDFLVASNKAKILEDPRITTVSGRTASLRAGETVNILTTTGGGTGTVATTQVQSFQTGVTLDITPVVNTDNYITVTLHPSVNSEAGVSAAGVPNIQTRDTTTTVGLHDGETIVIGGLIEDEDSVSVQKIPILGDIPIIGRIFQDKGINHTRNELIITVTPHIVRPGEAGNYVPADLGMPKPGPLPTLPPDMVLPPPRNIENAPVTPSPQTPEPAPQLVPVNVPTPPPDQVPPHGNAFTPAPGYATPAPLRAGSPVPATQATAGNPPNPLPSAFAQTNVYTYGSPPQNNFANASQPPQIFYVQVTPSVVKNGQQMTISAITSTNVAKLEFGPNKLVPMATLQTVNAGQWQSTFAFSAAGLPIGQANVTLLLTATTGMGGTVTLPIPLSLVNP